MNLVAKEFVAAQSEQDPGVLVLSRFAGAAEQMDSAIIVNPYDRWEVADALNEALAMSKEERIERWTALMDGLKRNDLDWWRSHFLLKLQGGRDSQKGTLG
jgi:trehalose 6-phosphate synthase